MVVKYHIYPLQKFLRLIAHNFGHGSTKLPLQIKWDNIKRYV